MLALRSRSAALASTAGLLAAALALFSVLLLTSGRSPLQTYASLLGSTLGSGYGVGEVLVKLIPLLFTALAVALPARLGLVNVGGEGQLHLGALFAATAALTLGPGTPAWLGLPVGALAGMLGGAAWALAPALLRARGWLNETISTLLLNYVAVRVVDYFVYGALRDPGSANVPQTRAFGPGFLWPAFTGRVHLGLPLGLVALAIAAVVISRTRWGYEIRVAGGNPVAAHRHGLPLAALTVAVLCAGGALAGLAVALLQGLEVETTTPEGVTRPVSLVAHWGLALAPRLLGDETAAALAASPTWTVAPLLALALALGWVAARR